ncbi:MAG: hypothetical protein WCA77_09435, partial [Thermoplasmata archaeon]
LALTRVPLSLGRAPFWWYLAGLGGVAIVGSLLTAHVPDDTRLVAVEGDFVGDELVVVRRDDWEAWQVAKGILPDWFEGQDRPPEATVAQLEEIRTEFAPHPVTVPAAPAPPVVANPSASAASLPAPAPPPPFAAPAVVGPPIVSPEPAFTSPAPVTRFTHPPSDLESSSRGAPFLPREGSIRETHWIPVRCVGCDRSEVPIDRAFECQSCGRPLCPDCASLARSAGLPARCPVCRSFDELQTKSVSSRGSTKGMTLPGEVRLRAS